MAAMLAGAAAAPAFAQGAPGIEVTKGPRQSIPIRGGYDHIVTDVTLSGHPAAVLIDNGFSISAVDRSFAAETKVGTREIEALLNGAKSARRLGVVLGIGPLTLAINPGLVDLSEAARLSQEPVKAIIGMELFAQALVGLDFTAGQMWLRDRQNYAGPKGAKPLRLTPANGWKHEAPIQINGTTIKGMVDLGFDSPLAVSPEVAQRLELTKGRKSSTYIAGQYSGDTMVRRTWGAVSIDAVTFAGETMNDVPVGIAPTEGAGPFGEHDAIIGLPLLRRFDLVFDIPAMRLWASSSARLRDSFERRYTGLQTEPSARGTVMVIHVAPGSPAEAAGFRQFDIIARIDGSPVATRSLRDIRIGQSAVITLENGETRKLTGARYY